MKHEHLPPVILLAGPTGVGKTALSLELAAWLETEIVNADSMQVYRYMDIGTAKPLPQERSCFPHHLLDVASPDEPFDAARYLRLAKPVVDRLHARDRIPLVVGGTGLYMKVLTRGICQGPPEDPDARRALKEEMDEKGPASMHARLARVDPAAAERIHPHDRQRILRALEVHRITGKPLSAWQREHRFREDFFRVVGIFLHRSREELYRRIDERTLRMMDAGFPNEVRELLERGYGPELKPMQSLGYKQLVAHLMGRCSFAEAVEEIQRQTRRYAKRQMTWFRGDPRFQWLPADDRDRALEWIQGRLSGT